MKEKPSLNLNIFQHTSYRTLLNVWIEEDIRRGTKTRLAVAAGCNPSWVTKVFAEEANFTADQAFGIAQFFCWNENETDYFLLLVEKDRAATRPLQERIEKKLVSLRAEGRDFGASIRTDSEISESHRAQYYSSWIYGALHVACMAKRFSLDEIALQFRLERSSVLTVLRKLEAMGLVVNKFDHWSATFKNVHLPSDHYCANLGHANWRVRTAQHLQEGNKAGLHYSGIHFLAAEDMEVVRQKLKAATLSCRETIEKSRGETLRWPRTGFIIHTPPHFAYLLTNIRRRRRARDSHLVLKVSAVRVKFGFRRISGTNTAQS